MMLVFAPIASSLLAVLASLATESPVYAARVVSNELPSVRYNHAAGVRGNPAPPNGFAARISAMFRFPRLLRRADVRGRDGQIGPGEQSGVGKIVIGRGGALQMQGPEDKGSPSETGTQDHSKYLEGAAGELQG